MFLCELNSTTIQATFWMIYYYDNLLLLLHPDHSFPSLLFFQFSPTLSPTSAPPSFILRKRQAYHRYQPNIAYQAVVKIGTPPGRGRQPSMRNSNPNWFYREILGAGTENFLWIGLVIRIFSCLKGIYWFQHQNFYAEAEFHYLFKKIHLAKWSH